MNTIKLRENISTEQYQMAVRVLEAIGVEVDKTPNNMEELVYISDNEAKDIAKALKRADESVLLSEKEAEQIVSKMWEKW